MVALLDVPDAVDGVSLGAKIRTAREQRAVSQSALAHISGVKAATVRRIEAGDIRFVPYPRTIVSLSNALGVPVAELMEAAGYPIGLSVEEA